METPSAESYKKCHYSLSKTAKCNDTQFYFHSCKPVTQPYINSSNVAQTISSYLALMCYL